MSTFSTPYLLNQLLSQTTYAALKVSESVDEKAVRAVYPDACITSRSSPRLVFRTLSRDDRDSDDPLGKSWAEASLHPSVTPSITPNMEALRDKLEESLVSISAAIRVINGVCGVGR
jgi:hypothetical protein